MINRHYNRSGFTLIELLTVIAIMAMLAAITAGGVSRVRSSQMSRNSEQTVTKLQLAIDQYWQAAMDQANLDKSRGKIPSQILTDCGNDLERASAIWAYVLLKRDLPQTFQEARNAVTIGTYTLQPRTTFASVPNAAWSGDENEAAALLYLILSDSSSGGAKFNADDATQGAQGDVVVAGQSYRVFKDAWGTPITFRRFVNATATPVVGQIASPSPQPVAPDINPSGNPSDPVLLYELDSPPYIHPRTSVRYDHNQSPSNIVRKDNRDPLDPKGKLRASPGPSSLFPAGIPGSLSPAEFNNGFNGRNRQVSVLSAGPNKLWDNMYDADNIVGYRLRRQGGRGD